MSFANLKKNRSQSLEKLSSQLDKMSSKGYSDPIKEKYWTPTRDAAGNAFAVIRFLPEPDGEDVPFVRMWNHAFQDVGGWYIEKSLSTLQKDDPVGKFNGKLWNSSTDDKGPERTQVRKQKRKLTYHSNILVIKDSANPENEGKVFLFSYGKKIFDKLNDLMNPQFEDETPVNPFDFWAGANFKLKIRQVEGYSNYDKSEFDDPSVLFDGDEAKLEETYNQLNSLQDLIDPKNFKTYEELEARLHTVLGISGPSTYDTSKTAESLVDEDLDMSKLGGSDDGPELKSSKPSKVQAASDDEDEDLAFFKSLAAD